jgi:hypothetical protein
MAKIYKSALGKNINMDMLRLANETTIAVGNMRANARGDELGHGGRVVKTRAEIVQDYHKLNTPVANDQPLEPTEVARPVKPTGKLATPVAQDESPKTTRPRGSLAGAIAGETEIKQEPLDPKPLNTGVKRI